MALPDQLSRYATKLLPPGFLAWVLRGVGPELVFTRWLDTQTIPFPGGRDLRCDTVAELSPADRLGLSWAVVVEFETYPAGGLPDRLLEYMGRLRQELRQGPHRRDLYPVAAAVVNLTGPAPEDNLDMVLPGPGGFGWRWRLAMRTLPDV